MLVRRSWLAIVHFLVAGVTSPGLLPYASAQSGYAITELPVPQGALYIVPRAINARGEVAGTYAVADSNLPIGQRGVGFLWSPTTGMHELPPLVSGGSSRVFGLDNQGLVVGNSDSQPGMSVRAVQWSASGVSLVDIAPVPNSPPSNTARGARNGRILATGSVADESGWFVVGAGSARRLRPLSPSDTINCSGMNATGVVVGVGFPTGSATPVPHVWRPESELPMTLTLPAGVHEGRPEGVNDSGTIVGSFGTDLTGPGRTDDLAAAIWQDGSVARLPSAHPGRFTLATVINASGQILGEEEEPFPDEPGNYFIHPLLWTSAASTPIDLAMVIRATNPEWMFQDAWDLNDSGQIVGTAFRDGRTVATPVPAPAGAPVLLMVALIARRKRR